MSEENDTTQESEVVTHIDLGGDEAEAKIRKLKETLKTCEAEKKEYLDGWQRSRADHINYKKDEAKRFEDMARFVIAGLIQDILPVLDSFDLALTHPVPKEIERGILLIRSQFEDILKKRGLAEMKVEKGDAFNPEQHESIGEIEADLSQGAIAEIVQRGYVFRDRVIRPARVRISKGRTRG